MLIYYIQSIVGYITIYLYLSGTNTSHGFSGSHSKYKQDLGQGPGKAFRPQDTLEEFCLTTSKLLNIRGLLVKKDRLKVSQAQ